MGIDYTSDDIVLLDENSDDILKHPAFYAEGGEYLKDRFGADQLHREAVAEWQREENRLRQQARARAVELELEEMRLSSWGRPWSEDSVQQVADSFFRDERAFAVANMARPLAAALRKEMTPGFCAFKAFQRMPELCGGLHNEARAKAVCLLAVMLQDENAVGRHPIFRVFHTPLERTFVGELSHNLISEDLFSEDSDEGVRWLELVRQSWSGLRHASEARPKTHEGRKDDLRPGDGMTWQAVMKAGEAHCDRNRFPGVRALAKIVGCSPSTMSKAIKHSGALRRKQAEGKAQPKSVPTRALSEAAAASAAQETGNDPSDMVAQAELEEKKRKIADDPLLRRLMQDASSEQKRAYLEETSLPKLKELAELAYGDPDAKQRARDCSR